MNEQITDFSFYWIFRKFPNFFGNGVCTWNFSGGAIISSLYTSTKVLVNRNYIIYVLYRLPRTRWAQVQLYRISICNIVAEKMHYPHPCPRQFSIQCIESPSLFSHFVFCSLKIIVINLWLLNLHSIHYKDKAKIGANLLKRKNLNITLT